jgi:hypothetical protein
LEVEEEQVGGLELGQVWKWTASPLGRQDGVIKVVAVEQDDMLHI